MSTKSHYFIAIPVEKRLKYQFSRWTVQERPAFQRFVFEEDYHLTLVFLGSVELEIREKLQFSLQQVAKRYQPFSLTVDHIGYFGTEQAPRVLWAGVKQQEALDKLQHDVFQICIDLGLKLDTRPYRPHITFARKYIGNELYNDYNLNDSFQANIENNTWTVSHFVMYQTHLHQLPKYEPIASFELNRFSTRGK